MIEWKMLIVVAHREASFSSAGPFRETLSALAGEGSFHSNLHAYLKSEPPSDLVQAIHQRTDGNPLFVAEVIRLLDSEGLISPESGGGEREWEIHIPEKVRLAILGQVQKLTAPCRVCLSVAASQG